VVNGPTGGEQLMRSADDNLVPSDKDLENLLRKAQKSAAKNEAYKKG